MNNLIKLSFTIFILTGCASGPGTHSEKAEAPTYTEKAGAVSLSSFGASVPCTETKWEKTDWRKGVSYANACVKAKDWRKVESIANDLAIHAPLTPWGPYFFSLAAQSRKDYPRSVWMIELALKKAPQEGLFHYQLGRLYWEQGDESAALKELKQASELNADLADAHYVMGYMALSRDALSEAEKLFQKAIQADHKHFPSVMGMAGVKMKMKEWPAAAVFLEDAIRLNPNSYKARLTLAQIQEVQLKNMSEALSTYKELRSYAMAKKLDDSPIFNLDEKIQTIEKSLSAISRQEKISARKPTSAEGQAKQ